MFEHRCELCDREIRDFILIRIFHVVIDVTCMMLFISKTFLWMVFQSFFNLGKIRSFPCTCGHKAFWHLTSFKAEVLPLEELGWFYLLFKYKFITDENIPIGECLRCMFKLKTPIYLRCYKFKPLNNLIYLQNLYKQK